MNPSDLLTDDEKKQLNQAWDAAKGNTAILQKFVDAQMPFEDHLQKSKEQEQWFVNMHNAGVL